MVGMLASSVVDRGFELWSSQTNDYKSGICCFSAKLTGVRAKTGLLGLRIMYQTVYLPIVTSVS
jgi:hypothetical protein